MNERLAVIVASDVAQGPYAVGASQRLGELRALASALCDEIQIVRPNEWRNAPMKMDLAVGQSWSTLWALRQIAGRSRRVWFDACDSTIALRLRTSHGAWLQSAAALLRDLSVSRRFRPDVVSYITARDAAQDACVWKEPPLTVPIHWKRFRPLPQLGQRRIVLVGDGNYLPNRRAAEWVLTQLVPKLRALGATNPVWIYGPGYEKGQDRTVIFAGYEPDTNALYRCGDIHIAPVVSGAGMNSKVAVPLLAGLTVITTRLGIQGLKASERTVVCDLNDFAPEILRVLAREQEPFLELTLSDLIEDDESEDLLARLDE